MSSWTPLRYHDVLLKGILPQAIRTNVKVPTTFIMCLPKGNVLCCYQPMHNAKESGLDPRVKSQKNTLL